MIYSDVITGLVDTDKIEINPWETAQRLKVSRDFESEAIKNCEDKIIGQINYKYAYVKLPLSLEEQNVCDFGFAKLESKSLYKNLAGCNSVYFMAATVGVGVDRFLSRLAITSQAEHFICDGIASSAVESLANYINDELKKDHELRPRFSPGFGDLDIRFQKDLLNRLNAGQVLCVSLNDQFFMTPVKTITAIIGIKG